MGYITTRRALYNDILSSILEDPTQGTRAARMVGEVLTAPADAAPAAYGQLAQDVSRRNIRPVVAARGAGILGEAMRPQEGPIPLMPRPDEER